MGAKCQRALPRDLPVGSPGEARPRDCLRDGAAELKWLAGCDVVHVYRRGAPETQRGLVELMRRGSALVYDNDDDLSAIPRQSPTYKKMGGYTGHRIFAETLQVTRRAQMVTTTTEVLADKYRASGVGHVEVIGNYLSSDVERPRNCYRGLVVGWIAGGEHQADADRLKIAAVLEALPAKDR